MQRPDDVLDYWLNKLGPEGWYEVDPAVDAEIRDKFEPAWHAAQAGVCAEWMSHPRSALALLILLDQMPRNMFRGTGRAFASDKLALAMAKRAIDLGWDMRAGEPERQFFYLPLMHAECLCDQERCVRLMLTRMPESGAANLLHAKAHREEIRRFGRFPHRNAMLERATTGPEAAYLKGGGYGSTVRGLQQTEAVSA
ncbi:DUF924 domain-containing protein [Maritimibacter sp. 55A14]|uniref:DUF924 family protein n=1 Tax=Maritimibacter sp. 55A14 TaxID=2174844 RepID=UPI000D6096B5|nr:DUF924 family protein [Maritimibacter sp. 55A14]PWE30485.1 DUF924 domain-containing protein [Maritimibacter sp. 55A14]